jgi:hypothetical protein
MGATTFVPTPGSRPNTTGLVPSRGVEPEVRVEAGENSLVLDSAEPAVVRPDEPQAHPRQAWIGQVVGLVHGGERRRPQDRALLAGAPGEQGADEAGHVDGGGDVGGAQGDPVAIGDGSDLAPADDMPLALGDLTWSQRTRTVSAVPSGSKTCS